MQARNDGVIVLRRRKARSANGNPEGAWTDDFEVICRACGDDPSSDYQDLRPWLQHLRGPYELRAGVAAYLGHVAWHCSTVQQVTNGPQA